MSALKRENDPESQKDLEQQIQSVKINAEALESTTSDVVLNVPPYDASATTPELAYPLDKIIEGEWSFLLDIYNRLESGAQLKPGDYPSFVLNRIDKLRDTKVSVTRALSILVQTY